MMMIENKVKRVRNNWKLLMDTHNIFCPISSPIITRIHSLAIVRCYLRFSRCNFNTIFTIFDLEVDKSIGTSVIGWKSNRNYRNLIYDRLDYNFLIEDQY